MKQEEILATCIDEIQSGKSTIEDCVARYPEMGEELRSLLQITARLKPDEVTPSLEFKRRARLRLFEEMQPASAKVPRGLRSWLKPVPVRVFTWVLIGLLALGVAGGSTVYAAQSSLPGDMLYPVKTGVENLRLAVTAGVAAKAKLRVELAQRRIDEVIRQAKLNRNVNVQALETVQHQFDEAIKELSSSYNNEAIDSALSRLSTATLNQQLELEQALANAPEASKPALSHALVVTRRGNTIAQVAYANHDFLERQPSVSDEELGAGQFKIDGILLNMRGRTWNVGGVIIENVYSLGKAPAVGSRVKLEGLVKDNNVFISRIEVSDSPKELTKLEGQFGGTNQNGATDIGGISVNIADSSASQLKPGDNVQLQSGSKEGELSITGKESRGPEASRGTRLSGILTAVNVTSGTITVRMAGSQITVNVSEARVENESGQTLRLSDLNRLVGQDVRLDGLYKKGDLLFARQLRVETEE